jgi:hypothetical protein
MPVYPGALSVLVETMVRRFLLVMLVAAAAQLSCSTAKILEFILIKYSRFNCYRNMPRMILRTAIVGGYMLFATV